MTDDLLEERAYLVQERLGMICENREPTELERQQAVREAEEMLKRMEKE